MRQTIIYYLLFIYFQKRFLFLLVACLLCLLQEYNTFHYVKKLLKEHKHILHMSKKKLEEVPEH